MTNYHYEPPQSIGAKFRHLADQLVHGPGTPDPNFDLKTEPQRNELQRQAIALIDDSVKGYGVQPNYESLVPTVMKAIDTLGTKPDDVIGAIHKALGIDPTQHVQSALDAVSNGGTPPAPDQPGTKPGGTPVEGLKAAYDAATQVFLAAKTPTERAAAQIDLDAIQKSYSQALDLEQGQVTLKDGTVITTAMLNDPDPAKAAQYQQAYAAAQTDIENSNAKMLNQYGLDAYNLATGRVAAGNATAIQQYNAEIANIRERLARDELSITQASEAVTRAVNGLTESRARTQQELDAAEKAAPYGTVGGKTEFTANDLGSAVAGVVRNGGGDPNAAVIKFPGYISLNPAASNARNDAALGVSGPLPNIPGLSLTDADIPRAPQLGNPGAIALPTLVAPKPMPVIRLPGQPGYNPGANGTIGGAYGLQNVPYLENAYR